MTHTLPEIIGALTSGTRMSEAMRDQVIGIVERSGWHTMDSAPKDGTPIIVCRNGAELWPRSCWWSQAFNEWVVREDVDHGKCTKINAEHLTHWMHLPEPPDQRT